VNAPETLRFALTVHYDGAPFHGWQLQPDVPTVQGTLEEVLARLAGGVRVPVTGSGRTDRGVHATGQVAAVDLLPRWDAAALRRSLNALLPSSVWVEEVRRVPPAFHPRFDARRRSYRYRVGTAPVASSPLLRRICWPQGAPAPDPELLRGAADGILGEHSFRAFARAGQEERGDRCHVHAARWTPWRSEEGESLGWTFHVTANRYLHHMVRYLVGTMLEIARGHRPPGDLAALLADPATPLRTSPPAPPEGLVLERVEYEEVSLGDDADRDPPADDRAPAGRPLEPSGP
jgi:tRNA pseudouridine38-40 synthase